MRQRGSPGELSEEMETFCMALEFWIMELHPFVKTVQLIFVYFKCNTCVCIFYFRKRTAKMIPLWEVGVDRAIDDRLAKYW